jgi:hypothetical protein
LSLLDRTESGSLAESTGRATKRERRRKPSPGSRHVRHQSEIAWRRSSISSTGTLGVDLAAQNPKTADCMIEWDDRGYGHVHCPSEGYRDQDLLTKLIDTQ